MESIQNISLDKSIYKLFSWNLLCKSLCDDYICPLLAPEFREWDYRKKLFAQIFNKNSDIDIFCFQEVDSITDIHNLINKSDITDYDFSNKDFNNENQYNFVNYKKKHRPMGISIFFRKSKFELLDHFKYDLKDSQTKLGKNFIVVAFFKDKYNNSFCVLNTHLKAFDDFEHVRINQIESIFHLITENKKFLNKYDKFNCKSIIFCGDLNASPGFKSIENINNFKFKDKKLDKFNYVFNYFDKEKEDYEEFSLCIFTDNLIKKAIDYIFYTKNVEIINKMIENKNLNMENGLPSQYHPSDHLYLKIEFRFR